MTGLRNVSKVISKRALQRLTDTHRSLTGEMRSLAEQHSLFIGALMACDAATQERTLVEYRDRLYSVHAILAKLRVMLERYCDDSEDAKIIRDNGLGDQGR